MRDALVRQAMPQNSWPTVAISTTIFADPEPSAESMIAIEDPRPQPLPGSLMNFVSVAAKVSASSTNQPIRPDQKTALQTPLAAPSAAPLVSSETWAEASYPVCVYIVSRKPSGST